MTDIGLPAIVVPPSMLWRNGSPAPGGWHCRLFWSGRDCRRGGYGRGTRQLRRRMFSRPAVTPGAPESSGDRNAGIATWRTPIGRRRCRGSEANVMGPDQAVWALRITARDRYSDRCWGWGRTFTEPVRPKDHADLPCSPPTVSAGRHDLV
jgi:hypothetical protein